MALRWACRQLGRRREAVLVVAARCVSVRSLVGGASESFANSQPSVRWCTGGWSNFLGKVRSSEVGGGEVEQERGRRWVKTRGALVPSRCGGVARIGGGSIISGGDRRWQAPVVGVDNYEGEM